MAPSSRGAAAATRSAEDAPDLVFSHANIVTLDPSLPRARSLRVRGERILAVSREPVAAGDRDALVIDCSGRTIVPGFIDAHTHLVGHARALTQLELGPGHVRSIADLQRTLRSALQGLPAGSWVTGRGYDEFALGRHPNRVDLDEVAPLHPLSLTHRSGHAHVLNSAALALAGITTETGDPPDALIDRDPQTGEPTGLLFGMQRQLAQVVPARDTDALEQGIVLAGRALLSLGVTSLHDTSERNGLQRLEQLRGWRRRGLLASRVDIALGWETFESLDAAAIAALAHDCAVRVTGVKLSVHEVTGRTSPPASELARRVAAIHAQGWQALMHAIEPGTIEAACVAVEAALARSPRRDHRHRIEHASICPPALARRIAAAGIVVVTQPGFIAAHGQRYRATVPAGEQPHLYPLATLLGAGVRVAAGADAPAGPADPLLGIRAAVWRRGCDGVAVAPAQAISPRQALRLCTTGAAHALRDEGRRGHLRPGMLADLAILSGDPTRDAAGAADVRVVQTVIGGRMHAPHG